MTVTYEVNAVELNADHQGLGMDRSCGPVANSTGRIYYLTDVSRKEKRIKLLQKRLAKKQKGSCSRRKKKKITVRPNPSSNV